MSLDPKDVAIWKSWAQDVLTTALIPSGPAGGLAMALDKVLAEREELLAERDEAVAKNDAHMKARTCVSCQGYIRPPMQCGHCIETEQPAPGMGARPATTKLREERDLLRSRFDALRRGITWIAAGGQPLTADTLRRLLEGDARNDPMRSAATQRALDHLEDVAGLAAEVQRLRALMVEVYRDGYQAGVDGDESDVLEVQNNLDAYLAALPPR
jgi:hypothetical protein